MGFDIQKYLIGVLILMGILITFGGLSYSMGQDYSSITTAEISDDFRNTYDHLDTITDTTANMESKIRGGDIGNQDSQTEVLSDTLSALKLLGSTYGVSKDMIFDFVETFNIPNVWRVIFYTSLIVLIVTTIIFMIFKTKGTT